MQKWSDFQFMKIGVDCHVLSGKFQGSRTFLMNLYEELALLNPQEKFLFFGHWDGSFTFGEKFEHIDYMSKSRWRRLTYQTNALTKKHDLDIYHISPLMLSCNSLLTVHDILFETHPEFFNKFEVVRNKLLVKLSVKKARQIHTVSQYSKNSLINIYGVDEKKIKVIPNGVNLVKFNPTGTSEAIQKILERFNIRNYILSVGRIEPRKNHKSLLEAYAIVKDNIKDIGPLVIVGQPDFGYDDFFKKIKELNLSSNVMILRSVDDEILPDIYRAARIFVYPSFAEGFGIPPLEAMASGVPVITSNLTAIPEVVQEAGLLIDPYNITEIAESMYLLLSDQKLSEELSLKGRVQAEKWSWKNTALSYIDAIRELKDR
jgi:glycosyltransferase involved in cell wall biosynthesis